MYFQMTVKPPIGVKNNLQRTCGTWAVIQKFYEEKVPLKPEVWKNLMFGLCFFYAIIHERKKYTRVSKTFHLSSVSQILR